jgi:hypothetical protein
LNKWVQDTVAAMRINPRGEFSPAVKAECVITITRLMLEMSMGTISPTEDESSVICTTPPIGAPVHDRFLPDRVGEGVCP